MHRVYFSQIMGDLRMSLCVCRSVCLSVSSPVCVRNLRTSNTRLRNLYKLQDSKFEPSWELKGKSRTKNRRWVEFEGQVKPGINGCQEEGEDLEVEWCPDIGRQEEVQNGIDGDAPKLDENMGKNRNLKNGGMGGGFEG